MSSFRNFLQLVSIFGARHAEKNGNRHILGDISKVSSAYSKCHSPVRGC